MSERKVAYAVVVTEPMVDAVHVALNFIRQVHHLKGGTMEVEQRVPIGHITGEPGAGGTSDVILWGTD